MRTTVDQPHDPEPLTSSRFTHQTEQSKTDATAANAAFDAVVRQFLHRWISHRHPSDPPDFPTKQPDRQEFVETGALRTFFAHHPHPLRDLLTDPAIARHLLRPVGEVHFDADAYEPLLSRFEQRIYNLAAHRAHLEIPFRYTPTSRQLPDGDPLSLTEMIGRQGREDIGMYFGTRRSDEAALGLLATQLRDEAAPGSDLPVHIVTEGYMTDSLRQVKAMTEALHHAGDERLHCFLIQRRHAHDDRHLGAALLLMNPAQPTLPQRVVFCDTLRPGVLPPWWNGFKHKIDIVFPQPDGHAPASNLLEDGGVNLQRLHDGVPVRHQDIDCAFYSAGMVLALIRVARATPGLIVYGSTAALVSAMTARMPDYFARADQPHDPVRVREANVIRRWNTGREVLCGIGRETGPDETLAANMLKRINLTVPETGLMPIRSLTLSDQTLTQIGLPVAKTPVRHRRLRQRLPRLSLRRIDQSRVWRLRRLMRVRVGG